MADFEDDDPVGAFVDMIDGIRSGQVVCVEVAVALPDGAPLAGDSRTLLSDSRVREALHAAMDSVVFDMVAAKRGALPPGHA